jgi:hypothetical protein
MPDHTELPKKEHGLTSWVMWTTPDEAAPSWPSSMPEMGGGSGSGHHLLVPTKVKKGVTETEPAATCLE